MKISIIVISITIVYSRGGYNVRKFEKIKLKYSIGDFVFYFFSDC